MCGTIGRPKLRAKDKKNPVTIRFLSNIRPECSAFPGATGNVGRMIFLLAAAPCAASR